MTVLDWAQVQNELPTLIGEQLSIPCQWGDQPRGYVAGPVAGIDILAESALGVDDMQWEDVAGGAGPEDDQIRASVIGQRTLMLSVRVWSPVQSIEKSARRYLERLRTRLALPSVRPALLALGLSFAGTEAVVSLDPTEDGRVVSEAVLDVLFAYVVRETDDPIPFIENTLTESEFLRDVAGNPTDLQITVDTREL